MTKLDVLVKANVAEILADHNGDYALAVDSAQRFADSLKLGSVAEYPVSMRKFYNRVLAQLRTDKVNKGF